MRYLILAAASGLALTAAGCAERPHAPRTALDCPAQVGELTRTSIAADAKSCIYKSADVDVTLELLPVQGSAEATLQGVETQLAATQPQPAPGAQAPAASAKADSTTAHQADTAAKEASEDAKSAPSGKVDIKVPGGQIHVEGDDNDDKGEAHIDLPGLHVDANNGHAVVNVAGVHVNASENGTDVHIIRDVRLRGEGFSRQRNGVRATFTSYKPDAPDGGSFVGYEAAGPKAGPLAVAIVHGRSEVDRHGRLYRDLERLVRRNGDMSGPD